MPSSAALPALISSTALTGSPEFAGGDYSTSFLAEMESLALGVEEAYQRRQTKIQTPEYVQALTDKFRQADVIVQAGAPVYWSNGRFTSWNSEWAEALWFDRIYVPWFQQCGGYGFVGRLTAGYLAGAAPAGTRITLVEVDAIDWVEADGDYARIHVGKHTHVVSQRMHALERLPEGDSASRAIVQRMKEEEAEHARSAQSAGAAALPAPMRWAMRAAAKVMTTTAHRI